MEDEILYQKFLSNGGNASLEEFMSLKTMMAQDETEPLKKKDDTQPIVESSSTDGSVTNTNESNPTEPILPQVAPPISQELEGSPMYQQEQNSLALASTEQPTSTELPSTGMESSGVGNSNISLPSNPIQNPLAQNLGQKINLGNSNIQRIDDFYNNRDASVKTRTSENPLDILAGKSNDIQGEINPKLATPEELAADEARSLEEGNQGRINADKQSQAFFDQYLNKDYIRTKVAEFNPAKPLWIDKNAVDLDAGAYVNQILEREKRGEVTVARNNEGQIIDKDSQPITDNSNILWQPKGKENIEKYNSEVRDFNAQVGEQNADKARFNLGNVGNEPEQDGFGEFVTKANKFGVIPTNEEYEQLTTDEARNEYLATLEATQNAQKNGTTLQQELDKVRPQYFLSDEVKIANGFDAVNLLNQGIENGDTKDQAELNYFTQFFSDKNNVMDFGEYWEREGKAKHKSSLVRENQANYQATRANIWNEYLSYKNDKLGTNQRFLEESVVQSSARADLYAQEGNFQALEAEKVKMENLYSQYEDNQGQMISVGNLYDESNKNFTTLANKRKEEADFQLRVEKGEFLDNAKNIAGQIPLAIGVGVNNTIGGAARIMNAFLRSDNLGDAASIIGETEIKVGNVKVDSRINQRIKYLKDETTGQNYEERNGVLYGVNTKGELYQPSIQPDLNNLKLEREETKLNGAGAVFGISKLLTDIALTKGTGKGLSYSAKLLNNSKNIATVFGVESQVAKLASSYARVVKTQNAETIAYWFTQTYNENYAAAEAAGIKSENGKNIYSFFMSGMIAGTSVISPDQKFLKVLNTDSRNVVTSLLQGNIKKAALQSSNVLKKLGVDVTNELKEEVPQQLLQDAGNIIANQLSDANFSTSTKEDYRDVVDGTIITVGAISLFGSGASLRNQNRATVNNEIIDLSKLSRNEVITKLALDSRGLDYIKEYKESAIYPSLKKSAEKIENEITTRRKYILKIPDVDKYTSSALSDVAPILQKIENKKADLKNDDGTFSERINKDIAVLTSQANAILDNDLNPNNNAENPQSTPQPEAVQTETNGTKTTIDLNAKTGDELYQTESTDNNLNQQDGSAPVQIESPNAEIKEDGQGSQEGRSIATDQLTEMGEGNQESEQVAAEIASQEEVILKPIKRTEDFQHTKGVFTDSQNNYYKSTEEKDNNTDTKEFEVLKGLQEFDNVIKVYDKIKTPSGSFFGMEKLKPIKENQSITLDDYRKMQKVAERLDSDNLFIGEVPDIGIDNDNNIKLFDFSTNREKSNNESNDSNFSTQESFKRYRKYLNENDRNTLEYEDAILHNSEFPELKENIKGFLYRLKFRPFDIGTYPQEGFVKLKSEGVKSKDGHYGIIEYEKPISSENIKRFELEYDGRSSNKYDVKTTENEKEKNSQQIPAESSEQFDNSSAKTSATGSQENINSQDPENEISEEELQQRNIAALQDILAKQNTESSPVENTVKTPKTVEAKPTETKSTILTKEEQGRNTLVGMKNDYNKLSAGKKNQTKGKEAFARINQLAKDLGYPVGSLGDGKISIKNPKTGKEMAKVKEVLSEKIPTPQEVESAKQYLGDVATWDGNAFNDHWESDLTWAEIRKGNQDIEKGKLNTVPARRLVNEINRQLNDYGGFNFTKGSGAQTEKTFISLQEIAQYKQDFPRVWNNLDLLTDQELENLYNERLESEKEFYTNGPSQSENNSVYEERQDIPSESSGNDQSQAELTSPEYKSLVTQRNDQEARVKTAKSKLDAVSKSTNKDFQGDQEDLFGERPATQGMFDERADGNAGKELIATAKREYDQAKAELSRLNNAVRDFESGKVKGTESINFEEKKTQPVKSATPAEKIDDFGEKIGGAKKDFRANLENITDESLATQPLSKSFPRPDFKKLVDSKILTKEQAIFFNYLYDQIPAKPRKPYLLNAWTTKVKYVIDTFSSLMTDSDIDVVGRIRESATLGTKFKLYEDIYNEFGFPNNPVSMGAYEIKKLTNAAGEYFAIVKGSRIVSRDLYSVKEAVESLKAIIDKNKATKGDVKLSLYQDTKTKKYFIGKKGVFSTIRLIEFDDVKEGRSFLENNKEQLQEMWESQKETQKERDGKLNDPRIGTDYRKSEDVTPKKFSDTFGFRGVEFGNYVNNNERQTALNEAYDAFMDLSTIIGVSPKALSLNGKLAMAFGARGSGNAMAHYEPTRVVINLTKTKGAGSLAHEWWHAFDNYLSGQRGKESEMLTDSPRYKGKDNTTVREEISDAFVNLVKTIKDSPLYKRSRAADAAKSKPYFSTSVEMTARAFENYVVLKMAEAGERNHYLANYNDHSIWAKNSRLSEDSYPYPLEAEAPGINKAYQDLFNILKEKKEGDNIALFQKTDEKFAEITPEVANTLIERLKKPFAKAFSNLNVTTDWNVFKAKAKALGLDNSAIQNLVRAFHGSPHSFDRFTTDKMGTGEGAQHFGWGLYFTDVKAIAEGYAKQLAKVTITNEKIRNEKNAFTALYDVKELGSVDKAIALAQSRVDSAKEKNSYSDKTNKEIIEGNQAIIDFLNKNRDFIKVNKNLYEVSLHKGKTPEQYAWLEWDKPLSDKLINSILKSKNEEVIALLDEYKDLNSRIETNKRALDSVTKERNLFIDSLKEKYNEEDTRILQNLLSKEEELKGDESAERFNTLEQERKDLQDLQESNEGRYVYEQLKEILGSDKEASLFLLENGIDGVKYPAESISRGVTSENARGFNYVVFDENAITIDNKVQFMQTAKGEIYGAKLPDGTIYINPNKLNANTPIHEFSHLWEQIMPNAWKKGLAIFKETSTGKKMFAQLQKEGNYSQLTEDQLWSEAMNTLIGNLGEQQYQRKPKGKMAEFIDWFKNAMSRFINTVTGKKELNKELDLNAFTDKVLGDLLGEKALVPESASSQQGDIQYSKNDLKDGAKKLIRDLVDLVKGKPGNSAEKRIFGKVTPEGAQYLSDLLGVNISDDFTHTIDRSSINHAHKNHGDIKIEESRGQIALTNEDYELAADIISTPDEVINTGKNEKGLQTVTYIKKFEDGTIVYIEEVRTGKKELALNSIRKMKGNIGIQQRYNDANKASNIPTPETTAASKYSLSTTNIPNLINFATDDVKNVLNEGNIDFNIVSQNKNIPAKTLSSIVTDIQQNGTESGFEKLQNSDWYQNLSDTEQSELSADNYVQQLLSTSAAQVKSVEKGKTTIKDLEQATQSRNKNLVTERIKPEKRSATKSVKKLSEIIADAAKNLKSTLIYGNPLSRKAAGTYNPSNTLIRIKNAGDLDTVAHELGHFIDDKYDFLGQLKQSDIVALDREIQWFAERGGSNPPAQLSPKMKAEYKNREGLAEFIRAYLFNPTATESIAPNLYKEFESILDDNAKESLTNFSEDLINFSNASNGDKITSNIQDSGLKNKESFLKFKKDNNGFGYSIFDKINANVFDSMSKANKAFAFINKLNGNDLKNILPENNFKVLHRVFAGVNGKIDKVLTKGMVDGKNSYILDSKGERMTMEWLLSPLDSTSEVTVREDMNEVIRLLVAQRTVEYAKKFQRVDSLTGIGAGIDSDLDIAKGFINDFNDLKNTNKEKFDRITEAARKYREYADAGLRYAVDKGRLAEEVLDKEGKLIGGYKYIKENNEYYVNLTRNIEITPLNEDDAFFGDTGSLTSAKEILKKSKGGTETIRNPYESLLMNTANMIKEADRNEIMASFFNPLKKMRSMGDGTPIDFAQIARPAGTSDKNVKTIYVNGIKERWQISADVIDAFNSLEGMSKDGFFLKILQFPAKVLRSTVTHFPVFAVRNVTRDTVSRAIMSRTGSGFKDMLHTSSDSDMFSLYGGSMAGYYGNGKEAYIKHLNSAVKKISNKGGLVINPLQKYSDFLQGSENINRIAEYKSAFRLAKKEGLDDYNAGLYAAFEARDLMDFAMSGVYIREINKYIPFLNAGVQGLVRVKKQVTERPITWAVKTAIYTLIPSLVASVIRNLNDDDEDYEELPAYQKDLFWNFRTPYTGNAWISIPKPYENGAVSALFDRTTSKIMGKDEAFDGLSGSLFQSLIPIDQSSWLGGFKPIIENMFNKDTFRGGTIVSQWEENKLKELRSGDVNASRIGQLIANGLYKTGYDLNPHKIDHLIKGYGTYFGDLTLKIGDVGVQNSRNKFTISQIGFAKDIPLSNAKTVSKVYDLAESLGETQNKDVKYLRTMIQGYYESSSDKEQLEMSREIYKVAKVILGNLEKEKGSKIFATDLANKRIRGEIQPSDVTKLVNTYIDKSKYVDKDRARNKIITDYNKQYTKLQEKK